MGRIPHSVDSAWGVYLRQKVPKDAGLFVHKWGYQRIYFILMKLYPRVR